MEAQYIIINENGSKFYFKDHSMKILHRVDGPAYECFNGDKHWLADGKHHRLDGAAIEYVGGGKEWWVNGKRHRTDGPAIEYVVGYTSWYVDGKELTEEVFNKLFAPEIVLTIDEIADKFGIEASKLKIKK